MKYKDNTFYNGRSGKVYYIASDIILDLSTGASAFGIMGPEEYSPSSLDIIRAIEVLNKAEDMLKVLGRTVSVDTNILYLEGLLI